MYLVDTDVLSATRKFSQQHPVAVWMFAQEAALFIRSISIMEIERGIEKQRRVDSAFARDLENWLQDTLVTFDGRILMVTIEIAQRWGRMQFQLGRMDYDLAIAATAIEHNLTVVTRNVRHFDTTGAAMLNPFETA